MSEPVPAQPAESRHKPQEAGRKGYEFGTFKGVFTPSILTILGVIMYLRFGWVLGNVGLPLTLLIVVLATSITLLTALSISALATNGRVGGGGAYWMISRTLGPEAGAAIGMPLYFAKALGISFYVAGFAESVVLLFPQCDVKVAGLSTLVVLSTLALISADIAMRAQFVILAVIAASLVSFFMGHPIHLTGEEVAKITGHLGFWAVFAVFFPAVTGIEAGLDMSGDLKDSSRSLPRGTLAALGVSLLVYLAIPIWLDRNVQDPFLLLGDSMVMVKMAFWGPVVVAGIWGATLSSALGSILGAPRLMQALARDHLIPSFVGKGYGRGDDPRVATAISFAIAAAGIVAGDLNLIAPVLSMFFLTSYGLLNACATFEGIVASPAWRPRFRVPWPVSFLGTLLCLGAMLMIDAGATIVALVVTGVVYHAVQRRRMRVHWGDMRYGILMLIVRHALYALSRRKIDERNWKPNVLVLAGALQERWHLIEIAHSITHGVGFMTVAAVVTRGDDSWTRERVNNLQDSMNTILERRQIESLAKVQVAGSFVEGGKSLIESYGYGPVTPNTILMGVSEDPAKFADFCELVLFAHAARRNLILVREGEPPAAAGSRPRKRIDVWWAGRTHNAAFMLAVAGYLVRTDQYEDALISLNIIAERARAEHEKKHLHDYVRRASVGATPNVLSNAGRSPMEIIAETSASASLVLLGMRAPAEGESCEEFLRYYTGLLGSLRLRVPIAFVMSSEEVSFGRLFEERV